MGVPKGTDNFSKYRDCAAAGNLSLIEDALRVLRKRKLCFQGLHVLANEMADRVGIHRTTLCRNPSYKRLLLNYLASQPGAGALVSDDDATPELLKAKLYEARLEAKNLRSRMASLEQKLSVSVQNQPSLTHDGQLERIDSHAAFTNTVILLKLVLERLNADFEVVQVDFEKGELLDLAAPAGRQVIAGKPRTREFLQVYRVLLEQEGKLGGQK